MKPAKLLAAIVAVAIAAAGQVHADVDADFGDQLHTHGIYGPRDYNAWLGKIVCERLNRGLDVNADRSAHFLSTNLPRHTTQVQAWEFLATAISFYCPQQAPALENAAVESRR
ncbi:DUF732 domain-containing protein [Mycobacterium sp. pUA109]|uniref:DUF732 domain-containing protein n=1 Tax=Mycobacterium sp. pUA109 TaxID=3238982 RepID=UPI00351ACF76